MDELHEVYYPLSEISEEKRDVALLELQNAQNLSNNQAKIYSQFANILIATSTLIFSIFLNSEKLNINNLLSDNNLFIFSAFLIFVGSLILKYFVDLQKEITINARKVVILRAMLGLDYTSIQLTLPKDRIEGATNPFNVKFFNGWFKFRTIPFWIIIILLSFVWTTNFYSFDFENIQKNKYYVIDEFNCYWILGILGIFSVCYLTFRISLLDKNETFLLHIGVIVSKLFQIKLLGKFEYSIYRSKLSYVELERLNVDFSNMKQILVRIEDKNYHSHKGLDYKALVRAALSLSYKYRKNKNILKSGGSTINMQLARTIFIPTNQNAFKRKLLELFIAKWLNQILSKEDLIKIYVASVRYGYRIMGLAEALNKYFQMEDISDHKLTKEQSFFLVERLSSLTAKVNYKRINHLLKICEDLQIDKKQVYELYKNHEELN